MDSEREIPCDKPPLPPQLSTLTGGYSWAHSLVGQSGGPVWRLHGKVRAPDLYLKHGDAAVLDDLTAEFVRLRWLSAHAPVPQILHFAAAPDEAWLLTTALPGQTAFQALEARPYEREAIVDALADALRRFHAIPPEACPFTASHTHRLALARRRIDAGLVDEDDFDEARQGWSAAQVWDAMQALLPLPFDTVVTHGDFSLDNMLMVDGQVSGLIDVGRAGLADRYQDVAIIWNCLGDFSAALQGRFLARYGITETDHDRLLFHLLLDELF